MMKKAATTMPLAQCLLASPKELTCSHLISSGTPRLSPASMPISRAHPSTTSSPIARKTAESSWITPSLASGKTHLQTLTVTEALARTGHSFISI